MNPLSFIITPFNTIFFTPIVSLLVIILHGLTAVHIPGALGLSIIILTVIIRLAIWPFMQAQLKSAKKMTDLKPHIDKLKQKHGKDQQAFAKAQTGLLKEHGINPAAGCLPSLVQLPIIIALYQTILALFDKNTGIAHINSLLYSFVPKIDRLPDGHFLGFDLASKPSEFAHAGWFLLLIPVITALLQLIQSRMMSASPVKKYPGDSRVEKKQKEDTADAMASMQTQMMYLMPLMVGVFSWQFPIGIAIYWNTFTIFGILQQYKISGLGALAPWKEKIFKK